MAGIPDVQEWVVLSRYEQSGRLYLGNPAQAIQVFVVVIWGCIAMALQHKE